MKISRTDFPTWEFLISNALLKSPPTVLISLETQLVSMFFLTNGMAFINWINCSFFVVMLYSTNNSSLLLWSKNH
jgi:hypothetical protein